MHSWFYASNGWSSALFIYSTLTEIVAGFIRNVTLAPFITWIDDNCGANSVLTREGKSWDQCRSANQVCYITCMVLFHAGYYINLSKLKFDPTTRIRHLGILINSIEMKFFVPEDRVENL